MPNYKHKSSKSDGKQTRVPFFLEKLNEKTRENFLIDIQNLESKLEKYSEKYDEAVRKRNNLTEHIDKLQHNEQNSINKFSQELEDKTKELNDLKEEIVMMIEKNELERDVNESRLSEKKQDLEIIKNKLMNENERLSKELHSLEEFKLNKSELTKKVKTLESEIEQGKSEYQGYVLQMQTQRKRDLTKIKQEVVEKVKEAGDKHKEQAVRDRPETLKRVIREEELIGQHVNQMSEKSKDIKLENESLKKVLKSDAVRIKDLELNERKLCKKVIATKKIIKLMEEKLWKDDETMKQSRHAENDVFQLELEVDNLKKTISKATEDDKELSKLNDELEASNKNNQHHLKELDNDVEYLNGIIEECISLLERLPANETDAKRHDMTGGNNLNEIASAVYKLLKNQSKKINKMID